MFYQVGFFTFLDSIHPFLFWANQFSQRYHPSVADAGNQQRTTEQTVPICQATLGEPSVNVSGTTKNAHQHVAVTGVGMEKRCQPAVKVSQLLDPQERKASLRRGRVNF